MLLQTNSYTVPRDKRAEHARLMKRFKKTLGLLGCDHFEVYEQVGNNWNNSKATGRFVQIMRFRDRAHYESVQESERTDINSQQLIQEFCDLVDIDQQKEEGHYATGFYSSAIPSAATRVRMSRESEPEEVEEESLAEEAEALDLETPADGDAWAEPAEEEEPVAAMEQMFDQEDPAVEEEAVEEEEAQPMLGYEPPAVQAPAPPPLPQIAPQAPIAAPVAPKPLQRPAAQRPSVMMIPNKQIQTISVAMGPRRGPLPMPLPAQQSQPAVEAPAQMTMSGGTFQLNSPPTPRTGVGGAPDQPAPQQPVQQPQQPPRQQVAQPGTFVINSPRR